MLVHEIYPLKEKTKSNFFEKVFLPEKLKIFFHDFKTMYANSLTKEHKHLIFVGPPGTAKTMIAVKFAAEELKKKAIIVNAGMLMSLKNPSGALKNIFEEKNAIIIFDEIESLLSLESLKHELLTYLQNGSDNKSPLVFATTNIADIQDKFPSLCRPGRFNPVLIDGLQNENDIKLLTNMILKEYNCSLNKETEKYLFTTLTNEKDIVGAKIKNILLCAKELTNKVNTIKQTFLNKILMQIKSLLRKKESESLVLLTKESLIKAFNFYDMNK
jgi:SpoVK/Ycf46/Vps4 family AAA+-type ATPase